MKTCLKRVHTALRIGSLAILLGAAALLGLNPSTLFSRMKKLGIPTRKQDGL